MYGFKLGIPELIVLLGVFVLWPVTLVAWWRIFSKAGHPGLLSLVMIIPFLNFVMFFWFAFTTWPIEKQLPGRSQLPG